MRAGGCRWRSQSRQSYWRRRLSLASAGSHWYTPSHVIHGIGFFALTWLLARRLPLGWRIAIAVALEAATAC